MGFVVRGNLTLMKMVYVLSGPTSLTCYLLYYNGIISVYHFILV